MIKLRDSDVAENMYEEMDRETKERVKRKYGIREKDELMEILQISTLYEMIGNGW